MTTKLSGESDAKGRNGYYKLAKVEFVSAGNGLHVDFFSKREPHSNCAPARLVLNRADAEAFHRALGEAIHAAV